MFVLKVLPLFIFVLQVVSVVHLYIVTKTAHADVPVMFIELNIIVAINLILLAVIYFFIYKFQLRSFWILPLGLALLLSLSLLIQYLRML